MIIFPLWDDIASCNITDGWMLTSSLDIKKCFLIFLNLTKLSPDQKMNQIWYPRLPTLFLVIFNSKNNLVWLMMTSMLSLFSFQALEKLDLKVLDFWLFTELSFLEWFPTSFFKRARITVRTYFQSPTTLWSSWLLFSRFLQYCCSLVFFRMRLFNSKCQDLCEPKNEKGSSPLFRHRARERNVPQLVFISSPD